MVQLQAYIELTDQDNDRKNREANNLTDPADTVSIQPQIGLVRLDIAGTGVTEPEQNTGNRQESQKNIHRQHQQHKPVMKIFFRVGHC